MRCVHALRSHTRPWRNSSFESRCRQRSRSTLTCSRARARSRAASHVADGTRRCRPPAIADSDRFGRGCSWMTPGGRGVFAARSPDNRSRPRPPPGRARTRSGPPRSNSAPAPATQPASRPPARPRSRRTADATARRSPRPTTPRWWSGRGHPRGASSSSHGRTSFVWGQPKPLSGQSNPRKTRPRSGPRRRHEASSIGLRWTRVSRAISDFL